MTDTLRAIDPTTLLEHRQWVRELARRLVADPSLADDVAQATWVAVLDRPPRDGVPPRAWLGAVVRNIASKVRRGEARRARRENAVARREGDRPVDELVAEADLQRRLSEAVVNLPDTYRTVILLRFFDGLAPRQMARRLDVPVETVRTRQKRAIARLRQQLQRELGEDWRPRCLAVALAGGPWPPLSPSPAAECAPSAGAPQETTMLTVRNLTLSAITATALLTVVGTSYLAAQESGDDTPVVATAPMPPATDDVGPEREAELAPLPEDDPVPAPTPAESDEEEVDVEPEPVPAPGDADAEKPPVRVRGSDSSDGVRRRGGGIQIGFGGTGGRRVAGFSAPSPAQMNADMAKQVGLEKLPEDAEKFVTSIRQAQTREMKALWGERDESWLPRWRQAHATRRLPVADRWAKVTKELSLSDTQVAELKRLTKVRDDALEKSLIEKRVHGPDGVLTITGRDGDQAVAAREAYRTATSNLLNATQRTDWRTGGWEWVFGGEPQGVFLSKAAAHGTADDTGKND